MPAKTKHPTKDLEIERALAPLIGEQLSAVTFVQNYLQLHFDGPALNVNSTITVRDGASMERTGDDQFRNLLCRQIAKKVRSVEAWLDEAILFRFEDGAEIEVPLEAPGLPEAVYYHDHLTGSWFSV